MSIPVIAFFNNQGGVGKTTLVYHLAWMLNELGVRVLAADLDPQANLTANFLDEAQLEDLLFDHERAHTIFGAVKPLMEGTGDIAEIPVFGVEDRLGLIIGDLALAQFEDDLASAWPRCLSEDPRAFRVVTAFSRSIQQAAAAWEAEVVLLDLAPSLGALNRSALVTSDYLITPLAPDLFSILGLRNLGPTCSKWRREWQQRLQVAPAAVAGIAKGGMNPLGYILQQHSERLSRPVKAFEKWAKRVPSTYRESVLQISSSDAPEREDDPYCLALIKNYRSLVPMAMEARKPIFLLKPADGAIGSHSQMVQTAYRDFKILAERILDEVKRAQAPLLN